MYYIETWDVMKSEYARYSFPENYRYMPVRQEFESLVSDAKNAQMARCYRIMQSNPTRVIDLWTNRPEQFN